MAQAYEKGTLYQISIIDFKPDPDQPRKVIDLDALAELAASIKKYGILQPLLFRVADDSRYLLIVSGERRYLAAKQVGILILPAIYVEGNHAEISLCQTLDKSREKLANTNIADWSNEDLQAATASVTAIRDAADTFLNSPGDGETPPSRELS